MERKVALIAGGVKGIGRGVGLALAKSGWDVAFSWRTSEDTARLTTDELTALGVRARASRVDVSDARACADWVAETEAAFGRIDALVNCVGPYHRVGLLKETPEGWREMFDTNLHPLFYLARAVAPGMRQRHSGRIVAFSMANADQMNAQPMVTAHYVAKVGVLVLVRSLARALAKDGITVNAVSPGFVASGSAPPEELDEIVKNIPMGYVGEVSDAVSAVTFLLSDEARYVTGSNVHVSGAWGI